MPGKRMHPNVEFLHNLKALLGYKTNAAFAEACGQTQGNMSNYLSGKLTPQKRVLSNCLYNSTFIKINPIKEICEIPDNQSQIPTHSGIYIIYDSAGNALYIGKASNFRTEVWQTLKRSIPVSIRIGPSLRKYKPTIHDMAYYYSLYQVDDADLRHSLEALLLRSFANQTHNTNLGSFS